MHSNPSRRISRSLSDIASTGKALAWTHSIARFIARSTVIERRCGSSSGFVSEKSFWQSASRASPTSPTGRSSNRSTIARIVSAHGRP
jgi:hypothetical protein